MRTNTSQHPGFCASSDLHRLFFQLLVLLSPRSDWLTPVCQHQTQRLEVLLRPRGRDEQRRADREGARCGLWPQNPEPRPAETRSVCVPESQTAACSAAAPELGPVSPSYSQLRFIKASNQLVGLRSPSRQICKHVSVLWWVEADCAFQLHSFQAFWVESEWNTFSPTKTEYLLYVSVNVQLFSSSTFHKEDFVSLVALFSSL